MKDQLAIEKRGIIRVVQAICKPSEIEILYGIEDKLLGKVYTQAYDNTVYLVSEKECSAFNLVLPLGDKCFEGKLVKFQVRKKCGKQYAYNIQLDERQR